ncbi:MAG: hypothetical protein F4213_02310 [Boseongicola sp. SB0677_bin_26]|nr:hypothetical protein [Boseongicola sp. SB0665_bin_10]MYG24850.1 hypothetical protein [Boseongicola sp. SB0677_bin_26]
MTGRNQDGRAVGIFGIARGGVSAQRFLIPCSGRVATPMAETPHLTWTRSGSERDGKTSFARRGICGGNLS